jgi:hypothetical protein
MPDSKLVAAMSEIEAVLNKHDIGAVVLLASPTHIQHLLKVNCSWSCAKLEDDAEGRRLSVYSHHSQFPDKATQKKCVEDTIGMFAGFQTVLGRELENLQRLLAVLGQHVQINHIDVDEGDYGARPDRT